MEVCMTEHIAEQHCRQQPVHVQLCMPARLIVKAGQTLTSRKQSDTVFLQLFVVVLDPLKQEAHAALQV
jgi:hypothetical protein